MLQNKLSIKISLPGKHTNQNMNSHWTSRKQFENVSILAFIRAEFKLKGFWESFGVDACDLSESFLDFVLTVVRPQPSHWFGKKTEKKNN